MKYHKLDKSMQKCKNWKVMPGNCLTPIIKCAYKKAQQQIKEEAFQDGDFLQKVHQYLSSPDVLENNSSSVCLFVPCVLRGPLTDLRQTWWVYVGGPPICPWGVLFRKGQRVDGSTGHFRFPLYYICASLTPHAATAPFAWQAAGLIRRLLLCWMSTTYVGGPGNCYWGILFLKGQRVNGSNRSMGQWVTFTFTILYMIADDARLTPPHCKKHTGSTGWRVNGSTGQRVNGSNGSTGQRLTFTFTILYMIAEDARFTPPHCKKHTAYDDTTLTPHRCKMHTASFARSTGKFPSTQNSIRYMHITEFRSLHLWRVASRKKSRN